MLDMLRRPQRTVVPPLRRARVDDNDMDKLRRIGALPTGGSTTETAWPDLSAGATAIDVLALIATAPVSGSATITNGPDGLSITGEDETIVFDTDVLPPSVPSPADLKLSAEVASLSGEAEVALIDQADGLVLGTLDTGSIVSVGVATVTATDVPLARPVLTPLRALVRVTLIGAATLVLGRVRVTYL